MGRVYTVVDFQHVKPGKGLLLKEDKEYYDGQLLERAFNPTKGSRARVETKEMQYLSNDILLIIL